MSKYLRANGIDYLGTLPKIKKKEDFLQPIYEAFTNSLEAIKLLENDQPNKAEITISLYFTKDLISKISDDTKKYDFQKIKIKDTGIGFNDTEFERLIALNDESKGFQNKGSGRVQFLHAFDMTEVFSVYQDNKSSTGFMQRVFTLSKSKAFLDNNSIIRLEDNNGKEIKSDKPYTSLIFKTVLSTRDKLSLESLTAKNLKLKIIGHYLASFCENRNDLIQIIIKTIVDDNVESEIRITSDDIPIVDQEKNIDVYYSKVSDDGRIERISDKEILNLKAFKISSNDLSENSLKLVSKGEIANEIQLQNLLPKDKIEGKRYLFLLSGQYIDSKDGDTRGEINILTESEFKEKFQTSCLDEREILLNDIRDVTNREIIDMYDEIKKKHEEKIENIEKLKKMFLLNPKTLKSLEKKIGINDSDDVVLRKVYEADAKIIAEGDAKIKHQFEELSKLNTTDNDYSKKLISQVDELVKTIPLQNKSVLTHYIARRKLVLDLFGKIIEKQLHIQETSEKSIDEKLLHNLIFQQTSDNPEESDLWLINEEFIYFKGTSEGQLGRILFDNDNIFKKNLSEEENNYRIKQEGDASKKRPDILLFPKEGKCIIIEFKSLDTNISEHLNQINRYASLINNLSIDHYNFTTYFGYLIGENMDIDDIQDNDSDFISSHQLDFIFRPYKRIIGKFGKSDGSLYTEVIKYSTLLDRALIRNKIFIDKLMGKTGSRTI